MVTHATSLKAYTYDFSNIQSFKLNFDRTSEQEAKECLRILVDFMRT